MNTVNINGFPLEVKEYKGQRVITFRDIDRVHERPEGTARRNFNTNRKYFIEDEDYFVRNSYEAKKEFGIIAPNGLILLTESGYFMLSKSLTDDLAWSVHRQLVNCYFKARQVSTQYTNSYNDIIEIINGVLDERRKNNHDSEDIVNTLVPCFRELDNKINALEESACNIEKAVSKIVCFLETYTTIFELPDKAENEMKLLQNNNSSLVFEFINECCERRCGTCNNVTTADLYRVFKKWCLMKNTNPVSKPDFIKQICEYFHTDDKRNIRKNVAGQWYYLITLKPDVMKNFDI